MKDTRCHVRRSIQLRSGEASEASTFRAVVAESSSPAMLLPMPIPTESIFRADALLATVIRYLFANDEAEAVRHLVSSSVSYNVYKGVDIFGQTDRAVFDVVLEGGPAFWIGGRNYGRMMSRATWRACRTKPKVENC